MTNPSLIWINFFRILLYVYETHCLLNIFYASKYSLNIFGVFEIAEYVIFRFICVHVSTSKLHLYLLILCSGSLSRFLLLMNDFLFMFYLFIWQKAILETVIRSIIALCSFIFSSRKNKFSKVYIMRHKWCNSTSIESIVNSESCNFMLLN